MSKEMVVMQIIDKETGKVTWEGSAIKLGERVSINEPHEHIPEDYVYPIGYIETSEGTAFTDTATLKDSIPFPTAPYRGGGAMSGTGYTASSYVKTAVCSKCEGYKTWNYWYHSDTTLCDDCYYIEGKYKNLSKEESMKLEEEDNGVYRKTDG